VWSRIVEKTKIKIIGLDFHPVIYSRSKTLNNNLIIADFAGTHITLRTGHKSVQSIQSYANILGAAGKRHQSELIIADEKEEHSNLKHPRTSENLCDDEITQAEALTRSSPNGVTNNGTININFSITRSSK